MVFVEWKDKYSLESELADRQHKFLLKMLNDLAAAGPGDKESAVCTCLSRMEKYAQEHFQEEEKLMRDNGYLQLDEHIKEHEGFIRQLEDYKDAVFTNYVPFQDMQEYLNNWLAEHVIKSDR